MTTTETVTCEGCEATVETELALVADDGGRLCEACATKAEKAAPKGRVDDRVYED